MNPDELAKQLGGQLKSDVVGQTSNAEEIAKQLGGSSFSQNEVDSKIGEKSAVFNFLTGNEDKITNPGQINFIERLKLSFGGPESEERQQQLERDAGLKGALDFGDIADVGGDILPFLGGLIGGAGGTVLGTPIGGVAGASLGAGAGEAAKQALGRALGLREDVGIGEELTDIGLTTAGSFLVGKLGGYVASRIPKLLGILTGEGDDVIHQAFKNPKMADLGIKRGDEALRSAVRKGSEQSIQLRNNFIKGYTESFNKLAEKYPSKLANKGELLKPFYDLLKNNYNVKIGNQGLDFTTSKIKANPGEITKIQNAFDALQNWDDFSLVGVNKFKQLVGALTKFPSEAGGFSKSPALGQYYRTLDGIIKKNLPPQAKKVLEGINSKFSKNIELYDEMVEAFNSGEPFTKIANSLGRNKDTLRQVLEFYEKKSGQSVLPVVAGREIGAEKNAAFGILNPRSWIDFFWSPQMQGRFITRTGKIINPIEEGVKKGYGAYQSFLGAK